MRVDVQPFAHAVRRSVGHVIVGKDAVVELLGHVLLEDVPGTGKTTLARTLDCQFRRIRFTPDVLPSNVTGLQFFNQKLNDFQFRAGPVFTNILLADESNRAPPYAVGAVGSDG